MTKAELVEEVARAAELNKRDAEVIVETVFGSIIGALHKGEKVELRGFGSFRTRERGPRRGRNPKTGEPVDVPAKRVPYFKPGKELKEYFTESPAAAEGAATAEGAAVAEGAAAGTESAPAPAPAQSEPEPAAAAGESSSSTAGHEGGGYAASSTPEGSGGESSSGGSTQ